MGREGATGVFELWVNARKKFWNVMMWGLGMLREE